MALKRFVVAEELASILPNMLVVVVLAKGINNESSNGGVQRCYEDATTKALKELEALPNAQSHPRIAYYRDTLKSACNISAKKFPQSTESLYKRLLKSREPLRSINPLVDFYNSVSIKNGVTAGAFDMEDLEANGSGEVVTLRLSQADDTFLALDAGENAEAVRVPPGEPSYCVGNVVLTRQLAWRQSARGLVQASTRQVMLMSEVLSEKAKGQEGPEELAESVRREMVEGLKQHFGVESESAILGKGSGELVMSM